MAIFLALPFSTQDYTSLRRVQFLIFRQLDNEANNVVNFLLWIICLIFFINLSQFFPRLNFVKFGVQGRLLIKNKWNFSEICLWRQQSGKDSGFGCEKPVPDIWISSCFNYLSFCGVSLVAFGDFIFQKLEVNQLFWLIQHDTFSFNQVYEQANFCKKLRSIVIGWTVRDWKLVTYLHFIEI